VAPAPRALPAGVDLPVWAWRGPRRGYVWVPGRYALPAHPGYVWIPGHWAQGPAGWVGGEGHWRAR
jgi:hypothetical protein